MAVVGCSIPLPEQLCPIEPLLLQRALLALHPAADQAKRLKPTNNHHTQAVPREKSQAIHKERTYQMNNRQNTYGQRLE
jgi:hypothetical protein